MLTLYIYSNIAVCNICVYVSSTYQHTDISIIHKPLPHGSFYLPSLAYMKLPTPAVRNLPLTVCHPLNCFLSVCMFSSVWIVNLYPGRKQLHWLEYSASVQFLLPLVLKMSTHFQSYLGQHPFPSLPSVKLLYTFLIQLDCFVTICIQSWDPLTS